MIFTEAESMLKALRELRFLRPLPELVDFEKKLITAINLKNEKQARDAIKAVDFFLAEHGEKLKDRILNLLPKENNGSTK